MTAKTVTDKKNHSWDYSASTATWTRATPTRNLIITRHELAEFPYYLDIQAITRNGHAVTIDDAGFDTFDAAAAYAHIFAR